MPGQKLAPGTGNNAIGGAFQSHPKLAAVAAVRPGDVSLGHFT